jgi:ribosomal protein S12 methylthiotransferase accessory factor
MARFSAAALDAMNESQSIPLSASERNRLCPLLAGPGMIRGRTLSLRLAGETVKLKAPPRYLAKLFDWCQGEMTLAEIEAASIAQWGDRRFVEFVEALLESGVLIDTGALLDHTAPSSALTDYLTRNSIDYVIHH